MDNRFRGKQAYYSIRVRGELDLQWSDWFDGMIITHDSDGNSTLAGSLVDQAALYGLLDKARDLGLVLLSVTTEPAPSTGGTPRSEHFRYN